MGEIKIRKGFKCPIMPYNHWFRAKAYRKKKESHSLMRVYLIPSGKEIKYIEKRLH